MAAGLARARRPPRRRTVMHPCNKVRSFHTNPRNSRHIVPELLEAQGRSYFFARGRGKVIAVRGGHRDASRRLTATPHRRQARRVRGAPRGAPMGRVQHASGGPPGDDPRPARSGLSPSVAHCLRQKTRLVAMSILGWGGAGRWVVDAGGGPRATSPRIPLRQHHAVEASGAAPPGSGTADTPRPCKANYTGKAHPVGRGVYAGVRRGVTPAA